MKEKRLVWWIKIPFILSIVIFTVVAVVGIAIGYLRLSVSDYYSASERAFRIPEIHSGFVPQGLDYDQSNQKFIVSGYMKDKSPSPVYIVDKTSGQTEKRVTFTKPDGSDYKGHAGGVEIYQNYLYIPEQASILVFSYQDVLKANDGDKIACIDKFSTAVSDDDYIGVSCLTINGDRLIVAEYFRESNSPTLPSHKITTSAGDYNQALAIEFMLDDSFPLGINPTPVKAFSLPDQVQGVLFDQNKIYLSTSWGLAFSHILEYDATNLTKEQDITVLGQILPLYSLDSASLVKDYKIAPMSEEIVVVDGYLYVMCESASTKYIFGNFTGAEWCYKTNLTKMK